MAAVDLGAQSGRVAVGRFDGERLERHRGPPVPERAGAHAATRSTGTSSRLYRETLDGLRAAAPRRHVDSVGVDSWGGRLRPRRRERRGWSATPSTTATRAARGAVERVLGRVPARELYERTGIQLMPINTIFELAAMAAEGDPALDAAETLLMIPDLVHYWLCRHARRRVDERDDDAVPRPAAGGWADDLLERLDVPARLLPEVVAARARALGAAAPRRGGRDRLGAPSVVAVATHDTASAVAAIPLPATGSAYISAGTWSLVGVEVDAPLITDAVVRREPHERGRRRRHLPPAAQRHRPLAPPRVPPRVGEEGRRALVRRARRARRGRAARCGRSSTRTTRSFADARRHAGAHP